jgi:4-carboxymuconolactone decarboxylase
MSLARWIGTSIVAGVVGLLSVARVDAQTPAFRAKSDEASLPKDIDPRSLARLPWPKREDMDEYGKQVFDELVGKGQASLRFHSPRMAKPLAAAHHYAKFETGLPRRLVEMAVLVTARELDNEFEWTQWVEHGQEAGVNPGSGPPEVEPAVIDLIRYCGPVTSLGEKDAAIINLGREMFGQRHVSSPTFAESVRLFGRRGTVDLVELMNLYSITGAELIAFDTHLTKGQTPSLPDRASTPSCARSHMPAPTPDPGAPLPSDVDPDSRSRLPHPTRADMDDYGKQVWDDLSKTRPAPLRLPAGRLYSPRLAKPLTEAHEYAKFGTELGARLTELAVLTTARELDNQFEWTQWEEKGRSGHAPPEAGPAIVDVIKYCKPITGLGEKDAAVITLGRELFGRNKVSSETFATALHLFGRRGVVDLVDLMALYAATGWELDAYDMHLQKGQRPLLPARGPGGCSPR